MMSFRTVCFKAKICKLFALKFMPYMLVAFILAIILLPAFNVVIAFAMFFYLTISLAKSTTLEECQKECAQA